MTTVRTENVIELPDIQLMALGQLVADFLGGHWQTGMEGPTITVCVKLGPNLPPRNFIIDPDGTVTEHA